MAREEEKNGFSFPYSTPADPRALVFFIIGKMQASSLGVLSPVFFAPIFSLLLPQLMCIRMNLQSGSRRLLHQVLVFLLHFLICVYVNKHVDVSFLINYLPFIVRTLRSSVSLAYFPFRHNLPCASRYYLLCCSAWAMTREIRKWTHYSPVIALRSIWCNRYSCQSHLSSLGSESIDFGFAHSELLLVSSVDGVALVQYASDCINGSLP